MKKLKHVLIIDDEADVLEIICDYLQPFTYIATTTALTAEDAIEVMKTKSFHLVITDILLPGSHGIELTTHIRKNYPETKVLVCSGGGDSGKLVAGIALDEALDQGAHSAIIKPFTEQELIIQVNNLLKLK